MLQIASNLRHSLELAKDSLKKRTLNNFTQLVESNSFNIYSGISGVAWFLYKSNLLSSEDLEQYLVQAEKELSRSKNFTTPQHSFILGELGPKLLRSCITKSLNELKSFLERPISDKHTDALDIFLGLPGVALGLLLIRNELETDIFDDYLYDIFIKIKKSKKHSHEDNVYYWEVVLPENYENRYHQYIGISHGSAGNYSILHRIANVLSLKSDTEWLQDNLYKLLVATMYTKNGTAHWPAKRNQKNRDLVQWCHGAPGIIHATEHFSTDKFGKIVTSAMQTTLQEGVLEKGYNICHGTSGNLLCIYKGISFLKEERHVDLNLFIKNFLQQVNRSSSDTNASFFTGDSGAWWAIDCILNNRNDLLFWDIL